MQPQPLSKYLSSVTSLSLRVPPFDFAQWRSKAYLKIKSEELMFAQTTSQDAAALPAASLVTIVPTDDPRIKLLLIPKETLAPASPTASLPERVVATMQSLKVSETYSKKELYLPVFSLGATHENPELAGVRLAESQSVGEAKTSVEVKLAKGRYQEEGLAQETDEAKIQAQAHIIESSFVFGKSSLSLFVG